MIEKVSSDIKKDIPETEAKAVSVLLDFVSRSADSVIQREWIKTFSQRINVGEDAVWMEFKKKRKNKLFKNISGGDGNNIPAASVVQDRKIGMSLEENLLNLMLKDRGLAEKIQDDIFSDAKCIKVFKMLASGRSEAEILDSLPESDSKWFASVALSSVECNNAEEVFNAVLKDINTEKLKKRRKELEKEIILMSAGKIALDNKKQEEYNKLTLLLKGSGK
jgi:DNA primase